MSTKTKKLSREELVAILLKIQEVAYAIEKAKLHTRQFVYHTEDSAVFVGLADLTGRRIQPVGKEPECIYLYGIIVALSAADGGGR